MDHNEKNQLLKWGKIALIVLTVFLALEALTVVKGLRNIDPAFNTISVEGKGESVSVPDIATFSFSVLAESNNVANAQSAVNAKIDAIIKSLKAADIEERDIKTTSYNVSPKYIYQGSSCGPQYCPPGKQIADGFTAEHYITVKVRNTANAGTALGIAGEAGATNISGISFTMDDPEQPLKEARGKAIEDAKEKAKVLSDQLGVRLIRVVSYEDSNQPQIYPMAYATEAKSSVMPQDSGVAPTLPTGENKTTVSVTVTYEIR